MSKKTEIKKTESRIVEYIEHIITLIDELDGYKCMLITEQEKLKRLTKFVEK